ncbi:DUF664 domain-containing protein [Phycicoccus sp. BSK3Z-2]|uniref:DUF664 domain-containing protein n=1 Tax=Phycicoccus avicenniae TaxID=2828860 RepID=A0A941HZP1_9MICO|nr:DUF664 domain-containing protein [Phycicoccus avicenniae]MBR7744308.1 DUF664 domain-containing protein [Phycicoccus avicenniae]
MSAGERVPPPWEPPLAGNDAEQLLAALDRQRWTFRWKADGLDATGLRTTVGASSLTIGGLLKHLALVEDHYATTRLDGSGMPEVWSTHDGEGWEFTSAAADDAGSLYRLYDDAVERARTRLSAAAASGGLDRPVEMGWGGEHASLRRLVCDLLEEYGRHTGHADLLREAVDGRTGEDPPDDWRPTPG